MHLLENVFTSEHGEAVTVLQLLTKFKMTLSEIDTYLNEYGNRLNSIEFLNVTQQQEINILKNQVATLQTKVNAIQLTLGDYLLRFNDLDVQLSVINGKIDINISDIDTLKTYVNNLGVKIIGINNTLNLLGLTVQGHTTQITNLETSVSSINSDLVDIDSSISLINTQLSNLAVFITDFESRLAVLETNVNNIGIHIIAINNLFNTIDLTVQGHTTQITNLENDNLTINNKNVAQDTTLTSHAARITLLENSGGGGGGSLTKLFSTSKQYAISSGQGTTLELGTYIFAKLPSNTDFSKIILIAVPYGDSAGDCQEICRCGFQTSFYVQSGVDMFLYARFLISANQNVSLRVNYTVYLRG